MSTVLLSPSTTSGLSQSFAPSALYRFWLRSHTCTRASISASVARLNVRRTAAETLIVMHCVAEKCKPAVFSHFQALLILPSQICKLSNGLLHAIYWLFLLFAYTFHDTPHNAVLQPNGFWAWAKNSFATPNCNWHPSWFYWRNRQRWRNRSVQVGRSATFV